MTNSDPNSVEVMYQAAGGWYQEKFNRQFNGTFKMTEDVYVMGHYTQMIWRNTKTVGCGKAVAFGRTCVVCRYSPPGNYIDQMVY
jgi:hypothetical protein